jgi:hypothetical protein
MIPEKALIQVGIRVLQMFAGALKEYVKAKYPQEEQPTLETRIDVSRLSSSSKEFKQ